MRKESIKSHIDRKINEGLLTKDPDTIRQELKETCNKFEKKIIEFSNESNIESIEKIKDVRSKYLSLYVFIAKQRIIDLYKVENMNIYDWNCHKKFKAFLFKEKIESKGNSI